MGGWGVGCIDASVIIPIYIRGMRGPATCQYRRLRWCISRDASVLQRKSWCSRSVRRKLEHNHWKKQHKKESTKNIDNLSEWAVYSLEYCINDGILDNDINAVNPKKNVTREDIAVMLYKMLGKAKLL